MSELIGEIIKEPRHFDAICTDLKMPRKDVEKILRENTEWVTVPAQNKRQNWSWERNNGGIQYVLMAFLSFNYYNLNNLKATGVSLGFLPQIE